MRVPAIYQYSIPVRPKSNLAGDSGSPISSQRVSSIPISSVGSHKLKESTLQTTLPINNVGIPVESDEEDDVSPPLKMYLQDESRAASRRGYTPTMSSGYAAPNAPVYSNNHPRAFPPDLGYLSGDPSRPAVPSSSRNTPTNLQQTDSPRLRQNTQV